MMGCISRSALANGSRGSSDLQDDLVFSLIVEVHLQTPIAGCPNMPFANMPKDGCKRPQTNSGKRMH
jgi:hypothetical protein